MRNIPQEVTEYSFHHEKISKQELPECAILHRNGAVLLRYNFVHSWVINKTLYTSLEQKFNFPSLLLYYTVGRFWDQQDHFSLPHCGVKAAICVSSDVKCKHCSLRCHKDSWYNVFKTKLQSFDCRLVYLSYFERHFSCIFQILVFKDDIKLWTFMCKIFKIMYQL